MKPLSPNQWNMEKAAHLLVRAGFAATPESIKEASRRPMKEVVDDLVTSSTPPPQPPDWIDENSVIKPNLQGMMTEFSEDERRKKITAMRREQMKQLRQLIPWWLNLMINSPNPLQEKMTLFWHGHFASSIQKVRSAYMMYVQNQMFRENSLGNWGTLLTAVSQDPAMLVYLDNNRSKADAPNENYARELMELFTLGEGHYSEDDIKASARAFTGWVTDRERYEFKDITKMQIEGFMGQRIKARLRDSGTKEFFGQKGDLNGHDIIRIILEQNQASLFMSNKLWKFFASEAPDPSTVEALARAFRKNEYEIAPTLKTLFMSEAFYSKDVMRTQIKSPVQWLVGSCIALDIKKPNPEFCITSLKTLGQELFAPPNVKGWDGGYAWITTSTLTQRYNLAGDLVNMQERPEFGRRPGRRPSMPENYILKTDTVLPREKRDRLDTALTYLANRIYQAPLPDASIEPLKNHLNSLPAPSEWTDKQIRDTLHAMMSTPQYQLV